MTAKFIRSGATGSNDGTSWADAWVSLESAFANLATTDIGYIAHDHSETLSAAIHYFQMVNGTIANIIPIVCVNDSANYASSSGTAPTSGLTTGAVVNLPTSGSYANNFNYSFYLYGVEFHSTATGVNQSLTTVPVYTVGSVI